MCAYAKAFTAFAYQSVIVLLVGYAWYLHDRGLSSTTVFHKVAFYLPVLAALFVVSLQLDYLSSIANAGNVNIKARMIDFVHWLMLVSINVSTWLAGQITPWWTVIQLIVLVAIGSAIGIGLSRQRIIFTTSEKMSAMVAALVALGLGVSTGGLRGMHMLTAIPNWRFGGLLSVLVMFAAWVFISNGMKPNELGPLSYLGTPIVVMLGVAVGFIGIPNQFSYGWLMDTLTGMVAITLVSGFIIHDLATIRSDHRGYPRALFLKGIFGCNLLVFFTWLDSVLSARGHAGSWMIENFGFTYVILVGNALYVYYYLAYEYYRYQHTNF